jgi:hypothetical protein
MASKQDLAEQLLRRADTDTVHAVERETASRWATAAVQWARGLVEEAGGGQKSSTEPEAVDGG